MSALDTGDSSKKRYLWWKPMAWLGIIRPTNASEKWLMQQWSTFFCMTLGLPMPWISQGTKCPCQAFLHDQFGDKTSTRNHTHLGLLTAALPSSTLSWYSRCTMCVHFWHRKQEAGRQNIG